MTGETDLDDVFRLHPQVIVEKFVEEGALSQRPDNCRLFELNEIAHHLLELTNLLSTPSCLNGRLLRR